MMCARDMVERLTFPWMTACASISLTAQSMWCERRASGKAPVVRDVVVAIWIMPMLTATPLLENRSETSAQIVEAI